MSHILCNLENNAETGIIKKADLGVISIFNNIIKKE